MWAPRGRLPEEEVSAPARNISVCSPKVRAGLAGCKLPSVEFISLRALPISPSPFCCSAPPQNTLERKKNLKSLLSVLHYEPLYPFPNFEHSSHISDSHIILGISQGTGVHPLISVLGVNACPVWNVIQPLRWWRMSCHRAM